MSWRGVFAATTVALLSGCSMTGSASTKTTVTRPDSSTFVFSFTEIFHGLLGGGLSMSANHSAEGIECAIDARSGLFVVTPTEVRLDGAVILKVPADAKTVSLNVDAGQIVAKIDGSPAPLLAVEAGEVAVKD